MIPLEDVTIVRHAGPCLVLADGRAVLYAAACRLLVQSRPREAYYFVRFWREADMLRPPERVGPTRLTQSGHCPGPMTAQQNDPQCPSEA
jgi:hypothetical protein